MVKAILLIDTIFWDSHLLLYFKHIFKLTKKFGIKMKNLKAKIVKEQIEQIWANKIIAKLDLFFTNNPD